MNNFKHFKKLVAVIAAVAAIAAVFSITALAEEIWLLDIDPRYDIDEKFISNSTDTRKHKNPAIMGADKGDIYYLNYSNAQNYYPANELPYFCLAENISIKTADFDKIVLEFDSIWYSSDTDISAKNAAKVYVSTDGGKTYSSEGATFTAEKTDNFTTNIAGGSKTFVYSFTSTDLKAIAGGKDITNIKLVPYGEAADGAFRLVALRIKGYNSDPEPTAPILDQYIYKTNEPVEKSADGKLNGYVIYNTNFENLGGWFSNSAAYTVYTGYINKQRDNLISYGCFPYGVNKVLGATYKYKYTVGASYEVTDLKPNPLEVFSPNMSLDLAPYSSVTVNLTAWIMNYRDPAFNFKAFYSTDNGLSWNNKSYTIDIKETSDIFYTPTYTNNGKIYNISFDLKEIPTSKPITNIVLMPFSDKYNAPNNEAFRMMDFKITGWTDQEIAEPYTVTDYQRGYDTMVIQKMIDDAKAAGKTEVTIPSVNPRDGSNTWLIAKPIVLPSDMTVYVKDCLMQIVKYAYCAVFTVENDYAHGITVDDELKNVNIIGIGDATLRHAHDDKLNKFSMSGRRLPRVNIKQNFVYFRNVNGFRVENLTCIEAAFWNLNFLYCRNGVVNNIYYINNNTVINQDGIDLRTGCNNITISNLYGTTGDDSVAFTALGASTEKRLFVIGKDYDIHDITVKNICTRIVSGCFNLRLLNHDGNKVYNIDVDGIYDTSVDFGKPLAGATVVLGSMSYSSTSEAQKGDLYNVTLKNIVSGVSPAVLVTHPSVYPEHWTAENVTMLKKGATMFFGYNVKNVKS